MAIEVGNKLTGKVSGITKFGAFVDLPDNKNGLVHISEVSDAYIKDIHDVLEVGQSVDVLVTNIADDGKIALSIRRLADNGDSNKDKKVPYKAAHKERSHKPRSKNSSKQGTSDFDSMMNAFLKDSDDRLSSLKRYTEGKRGGRGGRRS